MSDLINRADAIEAVEKQFFGGTVADISRDWQRLHDILEAMPSAEAEPIAIRSRTLMPTKDFKEWAKRIREVNPNAVVIPCDAEVASAEYEWIPCNERLPKEDARYLVQMSYGIMRVLSWANILEKVDDFDFYNEKHGGWYELDSEWGYCERHKVIAWMPLPKPYREEGAE